MADIICDKILKPTDVQHRLSFPTSGLGRLGIRQGDSLDFEAMDRSGRPWPFRLLTRENDDHPKPVLSKGWMAFVRDKGLMENDRIILRINEGQVEIQALRKLPIKLLGTNPWVSVEDWHNMVHN